MQEERSSMMKGWEPLYTIAVSVDLIDLKIIDQTWKHICSMLNLIYLFVTTY